MEVDNIYNMDCLEGMKLLDDKSVDCVICDLPYGMTSNKWDVLMMITDWFKRLSVASGVVIQIMQTSMSQTI